MNVQIYLDMDGVLTDFESFLIEFVFANKEELEEKLQAKIVKTDCLDSLRSSLGVKWYQLTAGLEKSFWEEMPYLEGAKDFLKYLGSMDEFIILSTPASSKNSREGKIAWIQRELGENQKFIIQPYKERFVKNDLHVPSNKLRNPGFCKLLIDDTPRVLEKWVDSGGLGILFDGDYSILRDRCESVFDSQVSGLPEREFFFKNAN